MIDSPDDERKSALDNDTIASPESTSPHNSCVRDFRLDAMTTIRNNSTVDVICVDETTTNRQEIFPSSKITAEDGMGKASVELNSPASSLLYRRGCPAKRCRLI